MEEMNQNNEEVVTEQRPSTKYGRTAYQQQQQEELGNAAQEADVKEPEVEQNPYQTNPYQQNPYQEYTVYEEPKKEVKNIFANVLMILVALSSVINLVATIMVSEAYHLGESLEEVIDATLAISGQPLYTVLSTLGDFILIATIVLLVLDIIQIAKSGRKYTGAILFAIFLRPAYFIWRAHLLGQKKVVPIIYAVCVYLLGAIGVGVTMMAACEMVLRTMMY